MRHLIIIPYYSEPEVQRYVRIADHVARMSRPKVDVEFLLAASPRIDPSRELEKAFLRCGPVSSLACRNQTRGHPQGPTAMFWEVLDHIAECHGAERGFALWLESDMIPIRMDWLDCLDRHWSEATEEPLVMGLQLPRLVSRHWLRRPKVTPEHINGGACYCKQLASRLPREVRDEVLFDVCMFPYVSLAGQHKAVRSFAFSTVSTLARDIGAPDIAILHGWKQQKDKFINRAIKLFWQAQSLGAEVNAPTQLRLWKGRCCQFAVWRGLNFNCPLHSRPSSAA